MKEINKPVWLWIAGLCMLSLVAILINQVIQGQGTEKVIISTADQIILFTLAGGLFLSWHMIGEINMKLKKVKNEQRRINDEF